MASNARTVNRRGDGGRLREEILLAATRLLGRATSQDAVTLRAIARETGVAAPSIYKHFADRDAVLEAVVSATFARLEAVCAHAYAHHSTGTERVHAISRAYVAFAAEHPSEYRMLFERSAGNLATDPHPYPAGIRAFGYLVDACVQMAAERRSSTTAAPTGADPVRSAHALWAALHGVVTLIPATPGFPWEPAADLVDHLLGRLAG